MRICCLCYDSCYFLWVGAQELVISIVGAAAISFGVGDSSFPLLIYYCLGVSVSFLFLLLLFDTFFLLVYVGLEYS